MACPNCKSDVLEGANFCHKCGTALTSFLVRLKGIYRRNGAGLFAVGFLLLGGLVYLHYSVNSGRLVVKLERINEREAFNILIQATIQEYCAQFNECGDSTQERLEANIAESLRKVVPRPKIGSGYGKITYYNRAVVPVTVTKLMSREGQEAWTTLENRRELLLLRQFPLAMSMMRREPPLQYKVRIALAKATVNHSAPFPIHPKEQRIWAVVNIGRDRQFQAEYSKNGKTYVPGIFRAR